MKSLIFSLCAVLFSISVSAQKIVEVYNDSPYDIEISVSPSDAGCSLVLPSVGPTYIPAYTNAAINVPDPNVGAVRIYSTCPPPLTTAVEIGSPCCNVMGLPTSDTFSQNCPAYTFTATWHRCTSHADLIIVH